MRHISDELARNLDRLLLTAESIAREHAAYQSYRADAAKHMRERVLDGYHRSQHEQAVALAAELVQVRERLNASPQVARRSA